MPGGRARYPSTVLMTAIPARVAGVPEVVLCVPPGRATARSPDATLAAAASPASTRCTAIGGAQAIGAMAYGTESIRPVDVIVGPGNVYVAVAKREVARRGPRRRAVGVRRPVARSWSSPTPRVPADFAAIDVVVQAEHGPDGLAWLDHLGRGRGRRRRPPRSTGSSAASPRAGRHRGHARRAAATPCSSTGPSRRSAVANAIAPEHLELLIADPEALLPLVRHAGAVFCGPWAPASVGDYLAGPSHVLPTFGSARFARRSRVDDFPKHVHVVDPRPRRRWPRSAPARGGARRGRGPRRPRRVGPPAAGGRRDAP